MAASPSRVASKYIRAREDAVFDAIIDSWVDAAFDALSGQHFTTGDVENVLQAGGVDADDLNRAAKGKTAAGNTTTLRALGGEVLAWVWHTVTHPFLEAWKLLTSSQARAETKHWIKTIARKEVAETRHMVAVASTLASGGEVDRAELVKAVHQFVDLFKTALIVGVLGHHFGSELIHDPLHILGMLASPADELVGIMLDKPLRAVTRHLLGHGFGLLPSSFYD